MQNWFEALRGLVDHAGVALAVGLPSRKLPTSTRTCSRHGVAGDPSSTVSTPRFEAVSTHAFTVKVPKLNSTPKGAIAASAHVRPLPKNMDGRSDLRKRYDIGPSVTTKESVKSVQEKHHAKSSTSPSANKTSRKANGGRSGGLMSSSQSEHFKRPFCSCLARPCFNL